MAERWSDRHDRRYGERRRYERDADDDGPRIRTFDNDEYASATRYGLGYGRDEDYDDDDDYRGMSERRFEGRRRRDERYGPDRDEYRFDDRFERGNRYGSI